MIQQLRLCAFNLGSEGSIPGEGSRIPHTSWDNQNKINKSWKCFAEQWTTNQKLALFFFFFLAKIETRKKVQKGVENQDIKFPTSLLNRNFWN